MYKIIISTLLNQNKFCEIFFQMILKFFLLKMVLLEGQSQRYAPFYWTIVYWWIFKKYFRFNFINLFFFTFTNIFLVESSGARVIGGCEPWCQFWELNVGLRQEQPVLVTTKPSLLSYTDGFSLRNSLLFRDGPTEAPMKLQLTVPSPGHTDGPG